MSRKAQVVDNQEIITAEDISVTISLYNKEHSIERAVLSVVNQTIPPREVIIVDDGSTDNSSTIARKLSEKFSVVTCIQQENSGVSVARNRGFKEAETRLVCLLDADDVWEPGYVDNLIELISAAPEANFYSLAYRMSSDKGWLKPEVDLPGNYIGIVDNPLKIYSRGYGLIHTSAICFKKDFFEATGGFPQGINFGEDLYLWMKACLTGTLAFTHKVSVSLYKEQINSLNRRKLHPYHVKFFTENLNQYSTKDQKVIRDFLIKNIYIQWAAAKLEDNKWQQKTLQQYCFRLSKIKGLLLAVSGLIPKSFIGYLKNRRTQKRLLSETH